MTDNCDNFGKASNGLTQADCVFWEDSNNNDDLQSLNDSPFDAKVKESPFGLEKDVDNEATRRTHQKSTSFHLLGRNRINQGDCPEQLDEENRYGVVHTRKRRRTKNMAAGVPPSSAKAVPLKRRLSTESSAPGVNFALANLLEQVATPATMKPSDPAKQSALLTTEHTLVHSSSTVESPVDLKTTSLEKNPSDEDDDDEFGAFDLDVDELAQIDCMVAATQVDFDNSQKEQPEANSGTCQRDTVSQMQIIQMGSSAQNQSLIPDSSYSSNKTEAPETVRSTMTTEKRLPLNPTSVNNQTQNRLTIQSQSTHQIKTISSEVSSNIPAKPKDVQIVNDEFDDEFPEIDFEALDKSIAEHTLSSQRELPLNILELKESEFASYVPSVDVPISNKASSQSSTLRQGLDFTRYMIIHVRSHRESFTKVLAVSIWNHGMADSSNGGKEGSASKIDGLVFLQGEWFHTELGGGDIIHLCSLSGHFSTGIDALPIHLHTCPPKGSITDDLVLVVHPDLLLTPTTISEAVTCTRRAVLKNRIGSTGLTSPAPLYGTMRHELFQACLRSSDFSISFINAQMQKILRENAEGLLSCGVPTREAELEVRKVIPQIHSFVELYTHMGKRGNRLPGHSEQLQNHGHYPALHFLVQDVESIEELIVSHELGLKGAVDIIVKANIQEVGSSTDSSMSLVPIELKTSRMQNANPSHLAQTVFYIIMLHTRYGPTMDRNKTGSGALLYMNNENMNAIHVAPFVKEIKSLIGQRNVVAIEQFRALQPRGVKTDPAGGRVLVEPAPPALLPSIETSAPCERCYTNTECMMYTAAEARHDKDNLALQSQKTKELFVRVTGHLSTADLEYFQKWDRLIDLEALHSTSSVAKSWLIPSEERERTTGRCISNLLFEMVESQAASINSTTLLCFRRSDISTISTSFHHLEFESGSHVVLSTDTATFISGKKEISHMHIFRGILHRVTENRLFLMASNDDLKRIHKISSKNVGVLFRLDRDEVATGVGTLRQNLINLFVAPPGEGETNGRAARCTNLRGLIINLQAPKFDMAQAETMFYHSQNMIPLGVPGCDLDDLAIEWCDLNPDQRRAAEMVMSCQDYTLIQGLPGTGKTSTVAFLVRLLLAHGKRVLITSYTHSAVDNALLKLVDSGVAEPSPGGTQPLVRIARASSCHDRIIPFLATTIATKLDPTESLPSAENLKKTMEAARVVGVSALSIPRSPLLAGERFDFVIVDEAGQISQPAIIGALQAANKFVLVGDHKQLPPLVQSEIAESGGSSESMLKRLADSHPEAISQLSLQYRMAQGICDLSNDISYNGDLKCANKATGDQQLVLSTDVKDIVCPDWVKQATSPSNVAVFIDTDGMRENNGLPIDALERKSCNGRGSVVNDTELKVVRTLVQIFTDLGVSSKDIGVICPFRSQLQLLGKDASISDLKKSGLELSTIDRYQGRDKDVIILSMVRSNEEGKVGRLLSDARRLNVAVTRAKKKLVIVGSMSTLYKGSQALRPALDRIRRNKRIFPYET